MHDIGSQLVYELFEQLDVFPAVGALRETVELIDLTSQLSERLGEQTALRESRHHAEILPVAVSEIVDQDSAGPAYIAVADDVKDFYQSRLPPLFIELLLAQSAPSPAYAQNMNMTL